MPEATVVLEIDKPHLTVRLFENMLQLDLKGSVKNEIEDAVENKPILRETIGSILSIFVPLHIRLSSIDSVHMDDTGKVKITFPHHRDIIIPLQPNEARKLVNKLNMLIPKEKRKEILRLMREEKLQKTAEEQVELGRTTASFPIQQSPELMAPELEDELAEVEEKEEEKKEE